MCFTAGAAFTDVGSDIFKNYLFYEALRDAERNAEAVSLVLAEASFLLSSAPVLQEGWLESLRTDKVIRSAYLRTGQGTMKTGEPFRPDESGSRGYRVAADGQLHYSLVSQVPPSFLEAVIDTRYVQKALLQSRKDLGAVFLWEANSRKRIILAGDESLLHDISDISGPGVKPFMLMRGLHVVIRTAIQGTDLWIFSVYRFPLGRKSFFLFGLIILLIFAIILFVWIIRSIRTITEPGGEGIMGAADEGKEIDVISEIDSEISDIIEEMGSFTEKSKAAGQKAKIEERQSELEKDGIIIRK